MPQLLAPGGEADETTTACTAGHGVSTETGTSTEVGLQFTSQQKTDGGDKDAFHSGFLQTSVLGDHYDVSARDTGGTVLTVPFLCGSLATSEDSGSLSEWPP